MFKQAIGIKVVHFNKFLSTRFFSNENRVDEFRKNAHKTIDLICDYYKKLESFPGAIEINFKIQFLQRLNQVIFANKSLNSHQKVRNYKKYVIFSEPEKFEEILKDVNNVIIPGLTNWQSPNFFAFYPSNSSFPAILGDLLSSGFAQQGMLWVSLECCTNINRQHLQHALS